jgi:hypothetical protein
MANAKQKLFQRTLFAVQVDETKQDKNTSADPALAAARAIAKAQKRAKAVYPLGIAGKTRRGAESGCLLTLLVETTAEKIRYSYSLNESDADDVKQDIYLHVLNNWIHYRPEIPIGAALRVMVGQGASRAVAKILPRGELRIVLATDTASADGMDFLSWVPAVDAGGSSEWNIHN